MRMPDPLSQFSYLISQLRVRHPYLSYIHLTEPRVQGDIDTASSNLAGQPDSNEFARKIWLGDGKDGRVMLSAGGYTGESAAKAIEELGIVPVFGRSFLANVSGPTRSSFGIGTPS